MARPERRHGEGGWRAPLLGPQAIPCPRARGEARGKGRRAGEGKEEPFTGHRRTDLRLFGLDSGDAPNPNLLGNSRPGPGWPALPPPSSLCGEGGGGCERGTPEVVGFGRRSLRADRLKGPYRCAASTFSRGKGESVGGGSREEALAERGETSRFRATGRPGERSGRRPTTRRRRVMALPMEERIRQIRYPPAGPRTLASHIPWEEGHVHPPEPEARAREGTKEESGEATTTEGGPFTGETGRRRSHSAPLWMRRYPATG